MAECIKAIYDKSLGPLESFLKEAFGYVASCEEKMELLAKEMKELQRRRDDLKDKIDTEERKGNKPTNQVQGWLDSVEVLEGEVAKIEASFKKLCRCLWDISPNVWTSYQTSKRAEKLLTEIKNLKEKVKELDISSPSKPDRFMKRAAGSLIGMDAMLKQLQDYANDERVSTIGIYGMGGVGKTTLVERFNNEFLPRDTISHVIWINMNDRVSVEQTQQAVGEKVGLVWQANWDGEDRANCIFNYLNRRNFVLVLDNVWEPIDLEKVGIPTTTRQPKSKIILTTRREDVCAGMDAKRIKVECLGPEEAWRLFVDKVGGEELIDSDPRIRGEAEMLVEKCGGLPLALITIGRALAGKKTLQQWKHVNTDLDVAPWKIPGMERDVLSRLKLSYDKLSGDKLRTCLMYCFMCRATGVVYKLHVIDYCIGEGIIDDIYDDGKEMYDEGHQLLGDLEAASLLEAHPDINRMRMHPMVRTMAVWIGCEYGKGERRWLVQLERGLKEAPEARKWREAERVVLSFNNIASLSESPDSPCLLTLFLQYNSALAKIPDGFFASMRKLKVLDLSWTSITELPAGVDILVALQYFDVCGTPIRSLPEKLGALDKLKFVLLNETPHLETIPDGVIRNFSQLHVLRMDDSYANWKVGSVGDGVDFEELNCLKQLKSLDITVQSESTLEKLAASHRLAASARRLYIKRCPSLVILSASALTSDMKNLQKLQICDSRDLEEFVIDDSTGGDNTLPNLEELHLTGLSKAKFTWKQGCLANLRVLRIWRCDGIEQLVYSKHEADAEEEEGSGGINVFPNLKQLNLQNLPKLESLTCGRKRLAFPSLEELWVNNCPNLNILGLNAEKLRKIAGPKSWWDGLEWHDHNIKAKLQPLFKEWP